MAEKRKKIFANKLHEQTFFILFFVMAIPVFITTTVLYYLVFQITAAQLAVPETITYGIIPAARQVTMLLLIATPIFTAIFIFLAHQISHAIFGPFDRILRELDNRISNNGKEPIIIRKKDKFLPLIERINKLLER